MTFGVALTGVEENEGASGRTRTNARCQRTQRGLGVRGTRLANSYSNGACGGGGVCSGVRRVWQQWGQCRRVARVAAVGRAARVAAVGSVGSVAACGGGGVCSE
eukprot:756409-Prymnesium_polylepis.1